MKYKVCSLFSFVVVFSCSCVFQKYNVDIHDYIEFVKSDSEISQFSLKVRGDDTCGELGVSLQGSSLQKISEKMRNGCVGHDRHFKPVDHLNYWGETNIYKIWTSEDLDIPLYEVFSIQEFPVFKSVEDISRDFSLKITRGVNLKMQFSGGLSSIFCTCHIVVNSLGEYIMFTGIPNSEVAANIPCVIEVSDIAELVGFVDLVISSNPCDNEVLSMGSSQLIRSITSKGAVYSFMKKEE